MRLAFIAAAAQVECRVQRRRRRRRRYTVFLQRKSLILQKFFRRLSSSTSLKNFNTDLWNFSGKTQIDYSILSAVDRTSSTAASSSYNRRCKKTWPFLAFWHLGSLFLFLISATLVLANNTPITKLPIDQQKNSMDESENRLWTLASDNDEAGGASEVTLFDDDSDEDTLSDSCHRYDYFLSPIFYASSSSSSGSGSNIVRRSVDGSSSPFYAAPNPAMDNVFAIWLKASRYGSTSRSSSSNFDHNPTEVDDSETSWPLQRPRTRHRYQHYRNIQNRGGSSSSSSRKWTTSTPTPTTRIVVSPRIRASLSAAQTSAPAPKISKKRPVTPFQPQPTRRQWHKKFPQCKVFDEACVDELCSLDAPKRVQELRNVYLHTNMAQREPWTTSAAASDSSSNSYVNSTYSNITLYEFFALNVQKDWQLSRPNINHLADNLRSCIMSDPLQTSSTSSSDKRNSTSAHQCRTCYRKLLTRLKQIDSRHEAFSQSVLSMIDCEPDNDLERFSPTSNCSECKLWYKRWLLVIFSDIWRQKPCLQWCHLAELACPHLQPVRKNDYAGLPSFRCTDPEISLVSAGNSTYGPPCDCVHPCDAEAHTKHWRWNIIGDYETREFCRDYKKRDRSECPAKKPVKKPSSTSSQSSKTKSRSKATSTKAPTSRAQDHTWTWTPVPIWLIAFFISILFQDYSSR